eukprot:4919519-Prymnesium_polylepis.1
MSAAGPARTVSGAVRIQGWDVGGMASTHRIGRHGQRFAFRGGMSAPRTHLAPVLVGSQKVGRQLGVLLRSRAARTRARNRLGGGSIPNMASTSA